MTDGTGYDLTLAGASLTALASGALWWPEQALLAVSDLHLGRAGRIARLGGTLIPPYEVEDTLARLDREISRTQARTVVCLGDSFDDHDAADIGEGPTVWLTRMMAGRRWIWIAGNHDPGPLALGGEYRADLGLGPLVFRHIATDATQGEVSGHYHPKFRLAGQSRPAFLVDARRLIMPAFGTYTGGLDSGYPDLRALFGADARAILTGRRCLACPLPPAPPMG